MTKTVVILKAFVSGNPTLPSKTPPTLKFLLNFEKKNEKKKN